MLGKEIKVDHKSPAELKLERMERMLMTVGVSLEILTAICAGIEDAAEEEVMDEDAGELRYWSLPSV